MSKRQDWWRGYGRWRRARRHLRWCAVLEPRDDSPFATMGAGVVFGAVFGVVLYLLLKMAGWGGGADFAGWLGAGVIAGYSVSIALRDSYRNWVVASLKELTPTSAGPMTVHRLFGIDEVTVRLMILLQDEYSTQLRVLRAPRDSRDIREATSVILRCVCYGGEGRPSKKEREQLLRFLETNFDVSTDLIKEVWRRCSQSMDTGRDTSIVVAACMEALYRCENEEQRQMLLEIAECCPSRGKAPDIINEIEGCIRRVSHGA